MIGPDPFIPSIADPRDADATLRGRVPVAEFLRDTAPWKDRDVVIIASGRNITATALARRTVPEKSARQGSVTKLKLAAALICNTVSIASNQYRVTGLPRHKKGGGPFDQPPHFLAR
jgi:hypothetical protein